MKIPRLRWIIAALLGISTVLNYLDRQALGVVSVDIRNQLHFGEQQYSYILTFFFLAYAIMYTGSGYLADRLGTRRGFSLFIFGWSLAQVLHGFVRGFWSLAGCRFLLGLSEPGAWPCASKAVSEWFPASQRALALGIFNAGSSIGSMIAPFTVAWLTIRYGWRSAFVVTGAAGFLWLLAWLVIYQPPHLNRWLRKSEYQRLKPLLPPPSEAKPVVRRTGNWFAILKERGCWTLVVARFATDPVIYFVIFWLPEYLRKARGFDLAQVGDYASIPFIFGGLGYVFGGWLSGFLMQRGWPLPRARKFVMALGASLMPVAIFAPFVPTAALAIAATCFTTTGHALWFSNLQTLITDLFPGHEVGSVTGLSGSSGAVGGMLAQLGTGYLVTHFSYAPVFLMAGLMHPISMLLIYLLLPARYFPQAPSAQVTA